MLEHYSHIRMTAKRAVPDGIVMHAPSADFQACVNQNVHQAVEAKSSGVAKPLN